MDLREGPSVRPRYEPPTSVTHKTPVKYGVHDTLRYGFASAKGDLAPAHPLEQAQAKLALNRESLMFQMLRDTQGLHAPLQLQMERQIVSKYLITWNRNVKAWEISSCVVVSAQVQRLPPLESSMIALETLTGNDESLGIDEVLNAPSDPPVTVDTHAAMEKKLKMI